jgi:hypothetical protein
MKLTALITFAVLGAANAAPNPKAILTRGVAHHGSANNWRRDASAVAHPDARYSSRRDAVYRGSAKSLIKRQDDDDEDERRRSAKGRVRRQTDDDDDDGDDEDVRRRSARSLLKRQDEGSGDSGAQDPPSDGDSGDSEAGKRRSVKGLSKRQDADESAENGIVGGLGDLDGDDVEKSGDDNASQQPDGAEKKDEGGSIKNAPADIDDNGLTGKDQKGLLDGVVKPLGL